MSSNGRCLAGGADAQQAALSEPQRKFLCPTNGSSQGSERERGTLREKEDAIVLLQCLEMGKSGVKKGGCVFLASWGGVWGTEIPLIGAIGAIGHSIGPPLS